MNRFVKVFVLACTVAVAGCAGVVPLQRAQVAAISRDTAPPELDRVLANATAVAQVEFQEGGKAYLARHYNLQTGTRQDMTMVCTPTCVPIFIQVPVTERYVVIQNLPARSVFAWGTLEELSKDADPAVSSLMPGVKQRLTEAEKKK
jgi:hypothetical protein